MLRVAEEVMTMGNHFVRRIKGWPASSSGMSVARFARSVGECQSETSQRCRSRRLVLRRCVVGSNSEMKIPSRRGLIE